MDQLCTAPGHVVVVATTNQIEGVEPSLRRPGRFDKEVDIPIPSAHGRREVGVSYENGGWGSLECFDEELCTWCYVLLCRYFISCCKTLLTA